MSTNSKSMDESLSTEYQKMVNAKYPFEREIPANCTDPDVLMDHILKISFLSDRKTLNQQAHMQAAEEHAMQICQIQCKRDGRMKREKDDEVSNDGKMRINQAQLLAKMEKEMSEKGMTKEERIRLEKTKAFHAALEAIPWTELNEPNVAEHVPKAIDDGKPKPFLSKSILSAPQELTAAEEAELKFDADRGIAIAEVDDDEDIDDKISPKKEYQGVVERPNVVLNPAIPQDAVAPAITEEMLALDPNNPEIVPQPIKERENRYSYAAKFGDEFEQTVMNKKATEEDMKAVLRSKKAAYDEQWKNEDENVAGRVADGTVIPIVNEGPLARADLPPVYRDGPAQRGKVLGGKYDPALDKPFLWSKNFRYVVVSMMGPDCPQQAPRRLFRVWGGVKTPKEGKDLMDEVVKKNPYGSWWRTYLYSIQRWIAFPPKGQKEDKGTVMEGNNEYAEYQQAFFDHQKHVTVELEQRALDTKAGEKSAGQTIIEQLKQKNMNVPGGVDSTMIPR